MSVKPSADYRVLMRRVQEIVDQIEVVDVAALQSLAKRLAASRPTLAALGPVGRVEDLDRVAARLN